MDATTVFVVVGWCGAGIEVGSLWLAHRLDRMIVFDVGVIVASAMLAPANIVLGAHFGLFLGVVYSGIALYGINQWQTRRRDEHDS